MSQQKWGWVFGFCRPEIFLFKCYVFGFVEAVLVFPRNVPTKSEAPTPPGQFLGVYTKILLVFTSSIMKSSIAYQQKMGQGGCKS